MFVFVFLFFHAVLQVILVTCYVSGFGCFKTYFESVNKNDHRLKKDTTGQQVRTFIVSLHDTRLGHKFFLLHLKGTSLVIEFGNFSYYRI